MNWYCDYLTYLKMPAMQMPPGRQAIVSFVHDEKVEFADRYLRNPKRIIPSDCLNLFFQEWIREKEPQVKSTNYGSDLFEVQRLQKKHQVIFCFRFNQAW